MTIEKLKQETKDTNNKIVSELDAVKNRIREVTKKMCDLRELKKQGNDVTTELCAILKELKEKRILKKDLIKSKL